MPRKKKAEQPIGVGLTARQMKRRKPINSEFLVDVKPLTPNQERLFKSYGEGKHMIAYGVAGTGKTYITLYNALKEVLNENTPYEKIYIVRSLVATREIGFLPGDHEDKSYLYQIPYQNMVKYMFKLPTNEQFDMLYGNLKAQASLDFLSTSFIRGTTFDSSILLVDECQNLNFHELDSIVTRVGDNTKIMFCGDHVQTDLTKVHEKNGIIDFMKIIEAMPDDFSMIGFEIGDIVRSGLVRNYIIAKMNLAL